MIAESQDDAPLDINTLSRRLLQVIAVAEQLGKEPATFNLSSRLGHCLPRLAGEAFGLMITTDIFGGRDA